MFESKEEKEATLESFFTDLLQDFKSLRSTLIKKVPEMAIDNVDPKQSLVIGANILTPVIDEMTDLRGINIVNDIGVYEIFHDTSNAGCIYIRKMEDGKRRVIGAYFFQTNEYCGTIEKKELTNLTSLLMLLNFAIK